MPFELGQLHRLILGHDDPLQVAELEQEILKKIGWRLPFVYLSRKSCLHILRDHTDIMPIALLRLPLAVRKGELILEKDRNRCLAACYNDPENRKGYIAVLKRAAKSADYEIWVSSFYRLTRRKLAKLRREGELIKAHDRS